MISYSTLPTRADARSPPAGEVENPSESNPKPWFSDVTANGDAVANRTYIQAFSDYLRN